MTSRIGALFSTFWGIVGLGVKRLRSTPESTFALLVMLASIVALVSSIPAYVEAANKQVLSRELGSIAKGKHPAFAFMYLYRRSGGDELRWEDFGAADAYLTTTAVGLLGLPLRESALHVQSDPFSLFPRGTEHYGDARRSLARVRAGFVRDLARHIVIVEGESPAPAFSEGPIAVLLSENKANELGVSPGEEFVVFRRESVASVDETKRFEDRVRLAGIWRAKDPDDSFWFLSPETLDDVLLVSEESYLKDFVSDERHALGTAKWYQVFDGRAIEAGDVPGLLGHMGRIQTRLAMLLPGVNFPLNPGWALTRYQKAVALQTKVLLTFSVPLFGLALGCIVFVSTLSVRQQRLEIAVLKSRGTSSAQVVLLYSAQSLLVGLASLGPGLVAGQLLARAIGHAHAFLAFGQAESVPVSITRPVLQFSAGAIGLAVVCCLLPAFQWARLTVVTFKRYLARITGLPWWRRYFVDVLLLAVSLYGHHVLKQQGSLDFLLGGSGDPFQNPLLLLAPTLLALSASLLFVRVLPVLMNFLAWASQFLQGIVPILSFRRLARSGNYDGVLMLLTLTVSLSVFTASLAKTLDGSVTQRAYYRLGADLSLQELGWASGSSSAVGGSGSSEEEDYRSFYVLPASEAEKAFGVRKASRVASFGIRTDTGEKGKLLGVERISLAQVAFFRHDFAHRSLGGLTNELALDRRAALVSEGFLAAHGLQIGDSFSVRINNPENTRVELVVSEMLHLFPTMYPDEGQRSLFVLANIGYLEERLGYPLTGQLWLAVDSDVETEKIVEDVKRLGFRVTAFESALDQIAREQARPERVGLFGFLSIGFAIISFLSVLCLMIHTLLSLRQQVIRFGILRALGLTSGQLLGVVVLEQFAVVSVAVIAGAAFGIRMSYLFLPFLQVSYAVQLPLPPLEVQIAWQDLWRVHALIGTALVLAVMGMIRPLRQIRMFEAIKLGEAQSL